MLITKRDEKSFERYLLLLEMSSGTWVEGYRLDQGLGHLGTCIREGKICFRQVSQLVPSAQIDID